MQRSTAESLIDKFHEIEQRIDVMCLILQEVPDANEKKRYIRILATALADLSGGILIPLANMHPGIVDLTNSSED